MLTSRHPEPTWSLVYAPSRRAVRIAQSAVPPHGERVRPYWRRVTPRGAAALAAAVAGLEPYAPSPRWRAG